MSKKADVSSVDCLRFGLSACACTRAFRQENNLLTVKVLTRKASKANSEFIFLQTHLVIQGNGQLAAYLH